MTVEEILKSDSHRYLACSTAELSVVVDDFDFVRL